MGMYGGMNTGLLQADQFNQQQLQNARQALIDRAAMQDQQARELERKDNRASLIDQRNLDREARAEAKKASDALLTQKTAEAKDLADREKESRHHNDIANGLEGLSKGAYGSLNDALSVHPSLQAEFIDKGLALTRLDDGSLEVTSKDGQKRVMTPDQIEKTISIRRNMAAELSPKGSTAKSILEQEKEAAQWKTQEAKKTATEALQARRFEHDKEMAEYKAEITKQFGLDKDARTVSRDERKMKSYAAITKRRDGGLALALGRAEENGDNEKAAMLRAEILANDIQAETGMTPEEIAKEEESRRPANVAPLVGNPNSPQKDAPTPVGEPVFKTLKGEKTPTKFQKMSNGAYERVIE